MAHVRAFSRFLLETAQTAIQARRWPDDASFVRAAYRAFLRREPEPGELAYHVRHSDRVEVIRSILRCPEYEHLYRFPSLTAARRAHRFQEVIKHLPALGFSIVLDARDEGLSLPLLVGEVYEAHVTHCLLGYLEPDTRFLDIGAGIGYYSLLVASRCPQGLAFSFEPDPQSFRLFKASIAYNGYEGRIQAYNYAVSDENAQIALSDLGNPLNYGARFTARDEQALRAHVHGPNPSFHPVQAVVLDEFLPSERVDLVKIDIEGYEPFALRGMVHLLERNRPVILAEFAPPNLAGMGDTSALAFLAFFIDLGYELNVIPEQGDLLAFDRDAAGLVAYYEGQDTHHLDLALTPG